VKIRDDRNYGGHNFSHGHRASTFRRTHSVGQKVHGYLLRWEKTGLGWVSIDNQHLLASISSKPAKGSRLTFVIQQLLPEIILKEIAEETSGALGSIDLLNEFNALRSQFETASIPVWPSCTSDDPDERYHAFIAALESFTEAHDAFVRVSGCVAAINTILAMETVFSYWPWLMPGATGQATTLTIKQDNQPFHDMVHEFESRQHGLVQIQLLYRHPQASYRVHLQHGKSSFTKNDFTPPQSLVPPGIDTHCLQVDSLPKSRHAGLLAELLLQT
jgi:hypothetical protein